MPSPANCRYSDSHEWFRVEGNAVVVGITQHAANELTDITYVELKPVGTAVAAGGPIGEVESVKTTSDVYSVVAGKVIAINDEVVRDPSLVNSDPFGKGWLIRIECPDAAPIARLMDAATYDEKYAAG